MPIYEYECPFCSSSNGGALRFEVRQVDFKEHLVRCPKCKAVARKLVSAVNWSFGWRLTDRSLHGGRGSPKDEYEKDI